MKPPKFLQPYLWSYDLNKLDLKEDKVRIVTNVLNLGSAKATKWLMKQYSTKEIKEVVSKPKPGEWSPKSLNFWQLVYDLPQKKAPKRRIK